MSLLRAGLCLLLVLSFSGCASHIGPEAARAGERLDDVMSAYLQQERYSGSALLAVDGDVVLEKGYGFTNWDTKGQKVTPLTPFNIGSIGKMFTQVLVLEKVEDGEWSLDDTLEALWPANGIRNAERITLRHLLAHESGLANYFTHPDYSLEQSELDDFIELARTEEFAFDVPGEGTEYSNTAFWVLAALLERHDDEGRDWETIYREEVFERADMDHVRWFQPDQEYAERPRGYLVNPIGERRDKTSDDARPGPDGGLYMPARDLYRFAEAVRRGEWYSGEMLEKTTEITGPFMIQGCDFALTWEVCQVDDVSLVTKGGTTSGGGAELVLFEHQGHEYTLVLLANFSNAPLENLQNIIRYTLQMEGARLPGPRPSVIVHAGMESGELPLEGDAFEAWMERNNVDRDPLSILMLALHYARNGQPEDARAVLKMNLSVFEDHALSQRVLKRLEKAGS